METRALVSTTPFPVWVLPKQPWGFVLPLHQSQSPSPECGTSQWTFHRAPASSNATTPSQPPTHLPRLSGTFTDLISCLPHQLPVPASGWLLAS